jgi:tyrosyl-tRNA synthetase
MGRDLQRHFGQRPQFGMLLPILPGLDGVQKMSKSLGNTVGLSEDPLSMYSKLEKVPDAVVADYLTLLTDLDLAALPANPRERQRAMAREITRQRHGAEAAEAAQADAAKLVGGAQGAGAAGAEVPEASMAAVNFPARAFYLIGAVGIGVTSSEAKRKIQDGGVRLDGEKLLDPNHVFASPDELAGKVLQLGKKTFRRLVAAAPAGQGTPLPGAQP